MRVIPGAQLALLVSLLMAAACGDEGADTENDLDAGLADAGGRSDADAGADASITPLGGADAGSSVDAARDAARPTDASGDARARDASSLTSSGDAAAAMGRSAGCGKAAQASGGFSERTATVMNRARTYHVRLPDRYDPMRAYPLVFRFHGYGGDGLSGGLGIEDVAGDEAIVVGPDGLNQGWSGGGEAGDLAFFDAMYDALGAAYCVDLGRVFAYGFSMGGGMTNALGCKRADKLRAVAPIAGYDRGTGSCARAVAAWIRHDVDDDAVPIAQGRGARDRMISRNHCTQSTSAAGEDCVRYEGCDEGYPVVYCETSGNGHDIAGDSAPEQVWEFFSSLR